MGDTQIGRNVNVGCGVITVNYDGFVIGRARQTTKPNYVRAWKAHKSQRKTHYPSTTK
ncbi:hypothetical protein NZD89_08885 [Alicyclobacillus fastidiosus]|uniref:Uncharacterized protein n=1 Tax=Alicyclobacillus fastidiosus TaxID=392011 RepID=A0ABY6ZRG9_9BACL|nr:hypothetical protein [Alicyclobacillus fastidiosus]WAH44555.1 hypothetical protein NZD89_08885 [Alicyclobacillus fastidiosus]